jgi:O-antigen/teichoic acid export membrane protein
MDDETRMPLEAPAIDDDVESPTRRLEERVALGGRSLRSHAARGVLINSAFQIGFAFLGLVKRVGVAVFLTASEFGLWGILVTVMITLGWLKQVGINDKYIQQDEADQELAFQKAFTLELAYTLAFYALVVIALPAYALLYDRPEIIVPGLVLSLAFLATALQTPIWIAYRQMRFVRQRTLEAIDPVVSVTVTLGLAAAGAGYWALVAGAIAGSFSSAAAAVAWSPYRLAWRFDRATLREYFSFSWPLIASGASGILIVQGSVLIGNYAVGLAGLGFLALAQSFSTFVDRVDEVIRYTIYPAICAVADRRDLLLEAFTKSNRLALMWGLPFGVALALFAPDLVDFVLGGNWEGATGLMQAFGLILATRQIAFNWTIFMRATNRTKPIAISAVCGLVTFLAVTGPLMIWLGLTGYAIGMAVAVLVDLAVRWRFMSQLFGGFNLLRHSARAMVPSALGAGVIGLARLVGAGLDRGPGLAIAELILYALVVIVATIAVERPLLREMTSYLGRGGGREPAPAAG